MPYSEQELDALMQQQAMPPSQHVLDTPTSGVRADQIDAIYQQQNEAPPAIKPPVKGEIAKTQGYDFFRDVLDTAKAWGEHLGIGNREMANAVRGAQMLYGQTNPDDFHPGETTVSAPSDYHNDFIAKNFSDLLGPAVEAVPQMAAVVGSGLATGAVGAGAGGATGLLGGPFAEVTVPGGAAVGFNTGFNVGAFGTAAALSSGTMYGQLREAGITDAQARPGAIAYGIAAGVFQTAGLRFAGKSGQVALEKWMQGAGVQGVLKRMLLNAGVNTGAGTLQSLTDQAIKTYEGVANGKASLVTKEWGKAFVDGLVQSAKVGIPLAAGVEATGGALGAASKAYMAKQKPTVVHAAEVVHEAAVSTVPDLRTEATQVSKGKLSPYEIALEAQRKHDEQVAKQYAQHEAEVKAANADSEAVNAAVAAVMTKAGAHERIKTAEKTKGEELTPEESAKAAESSSLSKNDLENIERLNKKITPWSHPLMMMAQNQEGRLRVIFREHPNGEQLARMFGTHDAEQMSHTKAEQYRDAMYDELEKSIGADGDKTKVLQLIAKAVNDKLTVQSINDEAPLHMSADEAIQFLIHMRNAKARTGMRARGFTFNDDFPNDPHVNTTERAIYNELHKSDPQYINVLDAGIRIYDKMYYPLRDALKQFDGSELKKEDHYGGQIRYRGEPDESVAKYEKVAPLKPGESSFRGERDTPGFTEERTGSNREIKASGFFRNLNDRIIEQANFEAMAEPSKLWNALLKHPDFKDAVIAKDGINTYRSVENGYKDAIHGMAAARKQNISHVDKILKANLIAQLAVKPMQTVKHLMTVGNFLLYKDEAGYIPAKEYLAGLEEFARKPSEAVKVVHALPAVKTRYGNLVNTALGAVVRGVAGPKETAVMQAVMLPFKVGDMGAVYPGAYSVYRYVLNRTGDVTKAENAAGKAINDVLASGMLSQLSDLSKNQLGKLLVQYQQPAIRLLQHQTDAIRLAQKFPTKENLAGAARAVMLTHIAAAAFVAPEIALKYLWDKDEQKVKDAVYTTWRSLIAGNQIGPWGYVMDFSFNKAYVQATGEKAKQFDYSMAIEQQVMNTVWLINSVHKQMTGDKATTIKSVFEDIILAAQGPSALAGVGVPVTPIKAVRDAATTPTNPFYIGHFLGGEPKQ